MWFCDSCGDPIDPAEEGWVEWITYKDGSGSGFNKARDLRLVHKDVYNREKGLKRRCQFDGSAEFAKDGGIIGDQELPNFLGPDGLMQLLELLGRNEAFERMEVVTMIMRLHIPGYEAARKHIEQAKYDGVIEPNMAPGFHWQSEIDAVIREYVKK